MLMGLIVLAALVVGTWVGIVWLEKMCFESSRASSERITSDACSHLTGLKRLSGV